MLTGFDKCGVDQLLLGLIVMECLLGVIIAFSMLALLILWSVVFSAIERDCRVLELCVGKSCCRAAMCLCWCCVCLRLRTSTGQRTTTAPSIMALFQLV